MSSIITFLFAAWIPMLSVGDSMENTLYTTSTEFNLNTNLKVIRMCRTKEDKEGICVSYRACRANYTIDIYGNIDDNEVRAGSCPGYFDWCCALEGPWKDHPEIADSKGCTHATETDCPWCVTLYRDGGNPRTKSASGVFCAGALIGSGLVLTSATCARAAKHQRVWGTVRSHMYNVTDSITHPQYDSGSREFDFAIMALSEKVDADSGACIQLNSPRDPNCYSYSFDAQDNIVMTALSITMNRCGSEDVAEEGSQAACARAADPTNTCRVALGAPVICPFQGQFGLWGIARTSCGSGEAHLGSIAPAALWVKSIMAMPPANGIR